jgi:ketosteroid isomerase-like protein
VEGAGAAAAASGAAAAAYSRTASRSLLPDEELSMNPIETVQRIYAAFGRGDIPAILAELADDVQWEYDTFPNPMPWMQPRHGRAGAASFFEALGGIQITKFEPLHLLADGRTVLGVFNVEFTVKATGQQVKEPEEVHIWHLDEAGKVLRFRHRVDTWQQAQALAAR